MAHPIRGFDLLTLSLDERTLLAHELLASVHHDMRALPLSPDLRDQIEHRLREVGSGRIRSAAAAG